MATLSSLKNALILSLLPFFKREKNHPMHPRRFLLVSTTALGDTLWATPAINALRNSFPNAFIGVLTSPIGYQVLQSLPAINEIFLFASLFSLRKKLIKRKFDTVLIFHTSQRLALPLVSTIGAAHIVGTTGINKGLDSLLTDLIAPSQCHEILRRLEIVEAAGGEKTSFQLQYFPDSKDFLEIKTLFVQKHLNRKTPIIVLHPGSKDGYKRWPIEKYIVLGKTLRKKGFQILITGGKDEDLLVQEVSSAISGAIPINLPFHLFAALLTKVSLVITNDTGPMHLSLALHTPVIALFAPTDPTICGPYRTPLGHVIAKERTCTPCLKRKCRLPFCLLQITPEMIIKKVEEILM